MIPSGAQRAAGNETSSAMRTSDTQVATESHNYSIESFLFARLECVETRRVVAIPLKT